MNDKNKPVVTVHLVGGLGNQLFGYFAGRYLATLRGTSLHLDMSHVDQGLTNHSSDIRSLKLSGVFSSSPARRLSTRILDFILERAASNSAFARNIVKKTFKVYVAGGVGIDRQLESLPAGLMIKGYFQTYVYVLSCIRDVSPQELELTKPSDWYLEMVALALASRPIMVHVRRGDYAKPENAKFGMLSADYYSLALEKLRLELGKASPVWVFSDEPDKVKLELGEALQGDVRFINPPEGTAAAESMMLMAKGVGNVISNSTFSWWSAILSPQSSVVAPTKWFKAMEDPEDLIPGSWLRQESVWK